MSSVADQIANQVLQDLYCEIIDQLNIDAVIPPLYSKRRITKPELDRLQNIGGNLIDQQRKHLLYSTALADKGKQGLDAFLAVLDETSAQYDPHSLLADKLRAKFQEYELEYQDLISVQSDHRSDECHGTKRTLASCKTSLPTLPGSEKHQGTHRALQSSSQNSSSLPIVNNDTRSHRSNLPVALRSISDTDYVVGASGSTITNMSPISPASASINDDLVTPPEVIRDGPLIKKSFNKSVDEGLGGSMLALHNPQAVNQHPIEQSPVLVSPGSHPGHDMTVTLSASKAGKDDSAHETDSIPRARPKLERSPHSLCDMVKMKLILLGNQGVGKSSLIRRFLEDDFTESLKSTTAGVRTDCYLTHTERKINVKLAVWDTAGQEEFNCISPNFYHNVDVVIMVFDMTDNESRKSLRAVVDWNTQLHHHVSSKDIPIILAGNKCESSAVNQKISKHAEHMVKQLSFHSFMVVSAKENSQVEALFERAIDSGLKYKDFTQHDPDVVHLPDTPQADVPSPAAPRRRKNCRGC